MYSTARCPKQIRRSIHLWKQEADTQRIQDDLTDLVDSIIVPDDIDTIWEDIKRKITETIESRVPSKMTTSRCTNPGMNPKIKRAIRRKQRAYRKARLTKKTQDKDRYKNLQREVQFKVRRANRDYLETSVSGDYKENSKKFWTYIKSKGQEATGVAPLKNKDGFIQSDYCRSQIVNSSNYAQFLKCT